MEHLTTLDAGFLEAEDADPHVSLAPITSGMRPYRDRVAMRIWTVWSPTSWSAGTPPPGHHRVHPGGLVLLVMTRWHERDLAGELLDAEPDIWTHANVPAVAETGVPDALGRAPGVAMTSALGFTADHFSAARRASGERSWCALYAGASRRRLPSLRHQGRRSTCSRTAKGFRDDHRNQRDDRVGP